MVIPDPGPHPTMVVPGWMPDMSHPGHSVQWGMPDDPAGPTLPGHEVEKKVNRMNQEMEKWRQQNGPFPELLTDQHATRMRIVGNAFIDSLSGPLQELASAARYRHAGWIKDLVLKKKVDVNAVLSEHGETVLHFAVSHGDKLLVKMIVEELGADLEIKEYGGFHALDLAAQYGFDERNLPEMDIATYLLDQGSEYSWFGACMGGDIDRINEFLDNGQDIEERGGWFNRTGFQFALHAERAYIARYLRVRGAVCPREPAPFNFPEEITMVGYTY